MRAGRRVLVLVHRVELIDQMFDALVRLRKVSTREIDRPYSRQGQDGHRGADPDRERRYTSATRQAGCPFHRRRRMPPLGRGHVDRYPFVVPGREGARAHRDADPVQRKRPQSGIRLPLSGPVFSELVAGGCSSSPRACGRPRVRSTSSEIKTVAGDYNLKQLSKAMGDRALVGDLFKRGTSARRGGRPSFMPCSP